MTRSTGPTPWLHLARWAIVFVIFGVQIFAIVYSRFVPSRYFCWAPYDMQTDYKMNVVVNGKKLSGPEVARRYRRPMQGVDNRSYFHLIDIIEGVENRLPPDERADVVVSFRINGKSEQTWRYPPR